MYVALGLAPCNRNSSGKYVITQGLSPTKTETENRRIGEGQQSMNRQRVAEHQNSRGQKVAAGSCPERSRRVSLRGFTMEYKLC